MRFLGVALLRSERRPGVVSVPQRDHLQSGGAHVRLVVQRQVFHDGATLRAQRKAVQVHNSAVPQVSGRLQRAFSRQVSSTQYLL